MNQKINRLHERALWIVYTDHESSLGQLLIQDNAFCIHHQNTDRLMIEIYKIFNDMADGYTDFFLVRSSHNFILWSQKDLIIPSVNRVLKRNSLRYFGSVV